MRVRAFLSVAIMILVGEVAATGRVIDPGLVFYAAVGSFAGGMTTGPRPRELGKWWGTIDQQIALEARRENVVLGDLRSGRRPTVPVKPNALVRLEKLARSEMRTALWCSYGALAQCALFAVSFAVHVVNPHGQAIRLVALALMVPVIGRSGLKGTVRSKERLNQLRRVVELDD